MARAGRRTRRPLQVDNFTRRSELTFRAAAELLTRRSDELLPGRPGNPAGRTVRAGGVADPGAGWRHVLADDRGHPDDRRLPHLFRLFHGRAGADVAVAADARETADDCTGGDHRMIFNDNVM